MLHAVRLTKWVLLSSALTLNISLAQDLSQIYKGPSYQEFHEGYNTAIRSFERDAEEGEAQSQAILGVLYYFGRNGFPQE